MRRLFIFCLAFVLLSLGGCYLRLGDFTLVSTKNLGRTYSPVSQRVSGEDCSHRLLFIPLGSLNPSIEEAADRAVRKATGADMLTNVSVYRDLLDLYIYARTCARVEGDPVNTASAQPQLPPRPAAPTTN